MMELAIGYAKEYISQKLNMKKESVPRYENEEVGKDIAINTLVAKDIALI